MSNEKRAPGALPYIRDEILHSYVRGILINPCKDPYQTTSIIESKMGFFIGIIIHHYRL